LIRKKEEPDAQVSEEHLSEINSSLKGRDSEKSGRGKGQQEPTDGRGEIPNYRKNRAQDYFSLKEAATSQWKKGGTLPEAVVDTPRHNSNSEGL